MEQPYPLKTFIISDDIADTNAIRSNILQHPGFFSLCQVTGSISDSYHILNAEKFDITICDHKLLPVDTIFKIGQQRFGTLVFLDKDASAHANSHPQAKGKSFYLRPPYNISLANLIGSLRVEFAERKLIEQITSQYLQKKITLRDGNRCVQLRQEVILYIKGATTHYWNVAYLTVNGPREIRVRKSLKFFENNLNSSIFFSTDRDCLINLLYVKEIDTLNHKITLRSDHANWQSETKISQRQLTELRKQRPDFFP